MLKIAHFRGGQTNTQGSCPGCGDQVPRLHRWSSYEAKDAYQCPTCGTFEYTSEGAVLPAGPSQPMAAVLDNLVECVQ